MNGAAHRRTVSLKPWQETDKKLERLLYLPDADYLKIASLGYRELIADLLWVQSIQVMEEKKGIRIQRPMALSRAGYHHDAGSEVRAGLRSRRPRSHNTRRASGGKQSTDDEGHAA